MRKALVALLVGWTIVAAPARADAVFDFSGVCVAACTGNATGVLTLSDSYVFGTSLTASDVLSLTYSSTTFTDSLIPGSPMVVGGLNADGTIAGVGALEIVNPGGFFFDIGGGGWKTTNGSVGDFGTDPSLTPVPTTTTLPEPSVLWMLLLVAPGLWYVARRARRR